MLDIEKLPPIFDTATLAEWSGMPVRRWADYRAQSIGPDWFRAGDGTRQILYTRDAVARWIETRDTQAAHRTRHHAQMVAA